MGNDYSWIAEKKKEAMMQKLINRGMPRYSQTPVSERFGMSYTGLGADGQLDRKAPAGIDYSTNPPHVFHQGELRVEMPEGLVYLNADIAPMANPALVSQGQKPQSLIAGRMFGFDAGGAILENQTPNPAIAKSSVSANSISQINSINTSPQPQNPSAPPTLGKVINGTPNDYSLGGFSGSVFEQNGWTKDEVDNANSSGVKLSNSKPNIAPNYLSTETPKQTQYNPNAAAQIQYQRDAEGQRRIDDMRREEASALAFQQHQQAMRGTDESAAWAQNAMLAAQKEEGINKFAAEYASGADERNWNRTYQTAMGLLNTGDPQNIAQAGAMLNGLFPGTSFDFTETVNNANAAQFNSGLSELAAVSLNSPSWEEAWPIFKASNLAQRMGVSEADLWSIFNGHNVNQYDVAVREFMNSEMYKGWYAQLSAEEKTVWDDFWYKVFVPGMLIGDIEFVYDNSGNVINVRLKGETEEEITYNEETSGGLSDEELEKYKKDAAAAAAQNYLTQQNNNSLQNNAINGVNNFNNNLNNSLNNAINQNTIDINNSLNNLNNNWNYSGFDLNSILPKY